MNNLAVGIELLFTGMSITFLVLVFLMYLMKATSALIAKYSMAERECTMPPQLSVQVPSDEMADAELVAMMTVLGKVLPANKKAVVKVAPQGVTDAEETERMVAAIAGALAAR